MVLYSLTCHRANFITAKEGYLAVAEVFNNFAENLTYSKDGEITARPFHVAEHGQHASARRIRQP